MDVLCKFSLVHRGDESVGMLSPFQLYFLESTLVHVETEEVINVSRGPSCMPVPACMSFPFRSFHGCGLTPLKGS